MKRLLAALVLALAAFAPALALAGGSDLRALVTGDQSRGWEGVGRLNIGGTTFCTGALIADNLVLTAGHCLYDHETGRQYRASDIQFLAGWREGRADAYRGARRAVVLPGFIADHEDRADDLALIELDRPIRNTQVTPFAVGHLAFLDHDVGVVSYAREREAAPSLQDTCHVHGRVRGTLVLDCAVDFGASGAPVFDLSVGAPRIVSVISAKAEYRGKGVAIGTGLESQLAELKKLLAKEGDGVFSGAKPSIRMTGAGDASDATGAKFLRP